MSVFPKSLMIADLFEETSPPVFEEGLLISQIEPLPWDFEFPKLENFVTVKFDKKSANS